MNRTIRFAGLILASLTISTVAMAQQGGGNGGGRGGDGGGGNGGGGDPSILEVIRQDHEKARLTRAIERRRGAGHCISHVCNEPPTRQFPVRYVSQVDNACAGGEVLAVRGRSGQIIRYVCDYRW